MNRGGCKHLAELASLYQLPRRVSFLARSRSSVEPDTNSVGLKINSKREGGINDSSSRSD